MNFTSKKGVLYLDVKVELILTVKYTRIQGYKEEMRLQ